MAVGPYRGACTATWSNGSARPGRSAIGVDLLFPEPSSFGASDDAAFASALARSRAVVLACAFTVVSERFYTKIDANLPVFALRRAGAGVGYVNSRADPDAVTRRLTLDIGRHFDGQHDVAPLVVELHRLAVRAGITARPVPSRSEILVNFAGPPGTFARLTYARVLGQEFPADAVRGRIVLLGATAKAMHDVFVTPFAPGGDMPGVEILANSLDTLLSGVKCAASTGHCRG